jgi:GPH family glycoside/pentoside/hexuronide:cation symporter
MNPQNLTLNMAVVPPAAGRLPMRQKVGFGLGAFLDMWGHHLYPSLAFHVFNIFLGVAPGLISTVQMIKIFIDAASDAVFGWISDNTRTRYGRRRPFILVGGVLAGIGLPLMFAVGKGWTNTEYFIFMLVSMVIYVPVMSCFNMPWVSLGSEMTPDYHERTTVMAAPRSTAPSSAPSWWRCPSPSSCWCASAITRSWCRARRRISRWPTRCGARCAASRSAMCC